MKFKAGYVIPIILALGLQVLAAQTRTISGRVTASGTGEALQGTQVFVQDTFIGSVTDAYGNYSLEVPSEEVTLIVAFIGYKTQELAVPVGEETANFVLETDVLKSEQVVVTGLASTVKRRNLANSVASISADDLMPTAVQTLDGALSGKFAGITVRQNTGAPGGGMSVKLRGVSSIEGATEPLYVVDGVIINNASNQSGIDIVTEAATAGSSTPQGQPTNRLGDINVNDIESVEVLKGASAAAIYGSKAANGVVIIKTKRGKPGKVKFNINQRFGFSSILKKMGYWDYNTYLQTVDQYGADLTSEGLTTAGKQAYADLKASVGADSIGNMSNDALDALFGNQWADVDVDYEEELYGQSGPLRETSISAGGGTGGTRYYVSGTVKDDAGIISGTGYKKYAGQLNLDHRFGPKATIGISTSLIRSESNRGITGNDNTNTSFGFSLAFTPNFLDIRKKDGEYPDHLFNPSNPLHSAEVLINREVTYRSIGAINFRYNMLKTGSQKLDFIMVAGADFYSQENQIFSPPELQFERNSDLSGTSILAETESINSNLYANLVHELSMGSNRFRTTGGVQYETANLNQLIVAAEQMVVTQQNVDQSGAISFVGQNITKQQDRGFFFQEEINLNDVIYMTGAIRADRSSTLGDTEKYYTFPKAAVSVRLSEFGFWPLGGISDEFKIRLAYGQTGNLPVANGKFTNLVPINIDGSSGLITANRQGASDVSPEITSEIEYGIDAELFGGLASIELTIFNQTITDLFLNADVPASSGFTSGLINGGEMETSGIEASLNVNLIRTSALSWHSQINFYRTKSEVTKLDVDPFNLGGFATVLGTYRIEEGWSPTSIVGAEMQMEWDAAGDSLKPVMIDSVEQHIKLGDETPDFQMSFNNSFRAGPFSFRFLLDWKKGGDIINLGALITDLAGTSADYGDPVKFTLPGGASDGSDTTQTFDEAGPARLGLAALLGGNYTSPYIGDGSYWKLREVAFSYTLSQQLVDNLFRGSVSSFTVGVSGRNLWMSTPYSGYDPEVSQFGNLAIGGSVDTIPFPSARSFYLDLGIGF